MRQYDYVKDWDPPYDPTVPPSGGSIRGRLQEDPFGPPSSSSESESEDGDEGSEYHPSDYEMSDNDLSEPEDSGYEESESKLLDQPPGSLLRSEEILSGSRCKASGITEKS